MEESKHGFNQFVINSHKVLYFFIASFETRKELNINGIRIQGGS